jgi:hypothetical protein
MATTPTATTPKRKGGQNVLGSIAYNANATRRATTAGKRCSERSLCGKLDIVSDQQMA